MRKKQDLDLDSNDEEPPNEITFINSDDYVFVNKLGEGVSHKYYLVKKKTTREKYAAKVLKDKDIKSLRNFMLETEILNKVNSRFILKCLGIHLGSATQDPFYISEYYTNGALTDLISKKRLTEIQKHKIIYGIASCMEKVHENGFIHCDLKPSNIYIDDELLPKVSGFNLSILEDNILDDYPHESKVGTMRFMAPELLDENESHTKSSDVYSFSIVMYYVYTNGSLPEFTIMGRLKGDKPRIPTSIPHSYAQLIIECMSINPEERPSFNEIVSLLKSDEFFQSESEKSKFFNFIDGKDSNFEQFDSDQFDFIKKIGTDYNTCDYFKVRDKNTNKKLIAKKLHKRDHSNNAEIISKLEKITQFNSNFIIHYKGYIEDESLQPIIVYDYYKNTLYDFININECTETTKLKIIYGIASEMAYIHSEGIIHTELNPNCIYIDNDLLPKIANFEVSLYIKDKVKSFVTRPNNIPFLAPELLNEGNFDQSVDVYSFSCILYFICTRKLPNIQIKKKMSGEIPLIPDTVPNHFTKLIKKCMSLDPKQRPSFEEIATILKSEEFITNDINKKEFSRFIEKYDLIFDKVNIEYPEINKLEIDFDPIDLSLYEKKSFVGSGAYGDVFEVMEKSTDTIYAAKINQVALEDCRPIQLYNLSREINILSKMNNVSILKFIGYSEYNFRGEKYPTIITEFSKNNSLGTIINLQSRGLSLPEWNSTKELICAYGIAAGMSYIHSLDILHRDLKPENIFLDEYLHPKIGDFGLAKEVSDKSIYENEDYVGTPMFISPETFNSFTYSKSGDVYAYAILLYIMFTNEIPYHEIGYFKLIDYVISGKRPEFKYYIPECYKNLIEKCWSNDPKKRPTFDEIMSILEDDEFITDEINKEEYQDYISFIKNQKIKKPFNKIQIDLESITNKLIEELSSKIICIDLNNYIKEKFIRREGNFKVYQIKNKETNEIFEAKKSMIIIFYLSTKEMIHLQREINILTKLKHPLFLKLIGLSIVDFQNNLMPVIVTEMPPNNSLFNLLQMERNDKHNEEWDDTEKLITIYGIASGMSYLHSHKVIHRNLSPESIFFDEYLHPKIGNFGLLTQIHSNCSITHQTTIGIKGNIAYASPEILESYEYSKSSDVYAFSLIVYEIMTNKIPFENVSQTMNSLFKEVVTKNNRPKFDVEIPDCYRNLIEECWSQTPDDRPTFEMIENSLTSDPNFITKSIDKTKFNKYVKFIKKSNKQFYSQNKGIELDKLIRKKKSEENNEIKKVKNDESKPKEKSPYVKKEDTLESKTKVKKESKNKNCLVDIKKICSDLLQKKYIESIDIEHINYLFDRSESTGTSLTSSNFKVKIGDTETDNDFISLSLLKKKIYIKNIDNEEIDHQKIEEFNKIYKIINEMNHPNIIKSLGFYEGDKNQAPTFLFEYYSKPLFEVIKTLDDAFLISIIYEIGHAMMIAHSNNLIHRNLNINDIFIDSNNHAKIRGFGTPVLIDQAEQINSYQYGSLFCLSRELLQNKEYTEKVDSFAFGMITLYILRRGRKPFLEHDEILEGKKAKISKSINKLSFSIISKCLSHSQEERPSFRAITHTIKKFDFKMIDGIDEKIEIIKNQLKSILGRKKLK